MEIIFLFTNLMKDLKKNEIQVKEVELKRREQVLAVTLLPLS